MDERIRVQVIASHALDTAGLRSIITESDDIELVPHQGCSPGCQMSCITDVPHVVVMMMSLDGPNRFDCVRNICSMNKNVQVLSVCPSGDPQACKAMVEVGAIGFISKQVPPKLFIKAIRQVASGKPFVEPWVAQRMIEGESSKGESSLFEKLTSREYTILQSILSGEDNHAIADSLHISVSTLNNHRSHIKRTLGVTNLVELIKLAISHGII